MKVLILTASPVRDKHIDDLIAEELTKRGHEVFVQPCVRGGRQKILELQPDVVVMPPVKNPFARDTAEECKRWGIGVVVRHTEASVDWDDFKRMSPQEKNELFGAFAYPADVELVWGPDEAQILSQRRTQFQVVSVGSLVMDTYFREDFQTRFMNRVLFNQKLGLTNPKTVLFASCWSFADTAPDLRVDEMNDYAKERNGRDKWIAAVTEVVKAIPDWNIVLKVHPGEDDKEYKEKLPPSVRVIKEQSSPETLKNVDCLIHAGSTMAMEAHLLKIPAFQFCDIYDKSNVSWFTRRSPVSEISPRVENPQQLIEAIKTCQPGSNANAEAIKKLETGRYGLMDGKAYIRAAEEICKVTGKFKFVWPRSCHDYGSKSNGIPMISRTLQDLAMKMICSQCGEEYWMIQGVKGNIVCPWCGIRGYKDV